MPTSKDNQQITIVLPIDIVKILDELAKKEVRTRSQQSAKIIIDFLKSHE